MRRLLLKRILLVFVPFLILALTPVDFRYCKGLMKNCEGCPMMEAENVLTPQVSSSQEPCCGSYHWEGLAFANPLQKADDSLKGKFTLGTYANENFEIVPSFKPSLETNNSSLYSYIPLPSFVLKQSFLI